MPNFILFGFKACGKTYWGKRFAQEIGYSFIDTDEILETLYAKQHGAPLVCSKIYQEVGEEIFRSLEHLAIASLENVTKSVIALGGGTVLLPKNREMLKKIGLFIYLKVDKKTLKQRIFSRELPAFFHGQNASFEQMYRERISLYDNIPAHTLILDKKSNPEVLDLLTKVAYGK